MEDVISRADAIRLIKNELGFLGSRETEAAVNVLQKMPAANTKAGGDGPAADIAQSICTESSFSTRDDTLPNSRKDNIARKKRRNNNTDYAKMEAGTAGCPQCGAEMT